LFPFVGGAGGSSSSDDAYISTTIATAGTYYVAVMSSGGGAVPVDATYELQVSVQNTLVSDPDSGDDILDGGRGDDMLFGGAGSDSAQYLFGNQADFTVMENTDGSYTVTDNIGDAGTDILHDIEYLIFADGTVDVVTAAGGMGGGPINGTSADDVLDGTSGNDVINGLEGNDIINGLAGDDVINAGSGENTVNAGDGNDVIVFNTADGDVFGDYDGGAGYDILRINGDYVAGDIDNDIIDASFINNDFSSIEEIEFALDGDDTPRELIIGSGEISSTEISNAANINGRGTGLYDSLSVNVTDGVAIDVSGWTFQDWTVGEDGLGLNGSAVDDSITGSLISDGIFGNDGNDILSGLGGDDIFTGGAGDDTDIENVQIGSTVIDLSTILPSSNIDGTAGNDNLMGTTGDDVINGLAGNDILDGLAGDDVLNGGDGADRFIGGEGGDANNGDAGFDSVDYRGSTARVAFNVDTGGTIGDAAGDTFSGIERYYLSDSNDTVTGSDANEFFYGEGGNDTILTVFTAVMVMIFSAAKMVMISFMGLQGLISLMAGQGLILPITHSQELPSS